MEAFSPLHILILLIIIGVIIIGVPWFAYSHGKKVGDQQGYIRGYKEGQQATNK